MARRPTGTRFSIDPAHERLDIYSEDTGGLVPDGHAITLDVWNDKYRWGDEEHPYDSMERVVEGIYANDPDKAAKKDALEAMQKLLWVPGGRIQAGAGTSNIVTLINCFVCRDIHDSMDGIADALKDTMLTLQQGGGDGMNFSSLRPAGAYLKRTGAVASGPLPFMDMWDSMCGTIMSAGSRRGAMMGVMDIEHPDIVDFIHAKRELGRWTNFNVSVLVTDAFLDAVKHDETWYLGFNVPRKDGNHLFVTEKETEGDIELWYAYYKYSARELWDMIIENTYEYSEPGVIFIDRINQRNNLQYCETITGTNPCVTGDTLILTDSGHQPIEALVGERVNIWNGHEWSEVVPYSTGCNKIYEVTFTNGHTVRCTSYHKWLLHGGAGVEAQELKIGDKLAYHDMPLITAGMVYNVDAYSQGFYCGDGTRNATESNLYKHEQAIMDRLIGRCVNRNCKDQPGHRWYHGKMLPKGFVPIDGDLAYCLNWLAGYLDADGCVVKKLDTHVVEASAKDREFLRLMGLMLNRLGVNYRMWERKDGGPKKGSNGKTYECENTAALMINKGSMHELVELGLHCERLDLEPFKQPPGGIARVGHRVIAIEPDVDVEETFCVTEPIRGMCTFNGLVGPNCGEQPLPPNGCCNLGAVNLARMVKRPYTDKAAFDFRLLGDTVEVGVRFLDNVIDRTLYPLDAQAQEEIAKRRIGLGVTGLANCLAQLGLRYGSPAAADKVDEIMRHLCHQAYAASAMLADERGAFPLYDAERWGENSPVVHNLPQAIKDSIADLGIRNGVLLTIAPTGTTSLYIGSVSSGLEPVFQHKALRKVKQANGDYKPYTVYDYGYLLHSVVHGRPPRDDDPSMVAHDDLTVDEHIVMQATCQKWVDASISKTINCPQDISFEDFKNIYTMAYELGLKGCTTYRYSEIRGSILTSDSAAKGAEDDRERKLVRPQVLSGRTYKLKWPNVDDNYYVTINDIGDQPFEMFIQSTSSKYADWATALSLMVSANMRKGGDIGFIAEELMKVRSADDAGYVEGQFYGSLVALIGYTIGQHCNHHTIQQSPEEVLEVPQNPSTKRDRGETCPVCNQPALYRIEGCDKCTNCTYSKC